MQALVNDMSVRELRATIADGGVSSEGICEKDELRALALQILMSSLPPAATPPPTVPDHVTRHAKDPLAQAAGRRERVASVEEDDEEKCGVCFAWLESGGSSFRSLPTGELESDQSGTIRRPPATRRCLPAAFAVICILLCWGLFFGLLYWLVLERGARLGQPHLGDTSSLVPQAAQVLADGSSNDEITPKAQSRTTVHASSAAAASTTAPPPPSPSPSPRPSPLPPPPSPSPPSPPPACLWALRGGINLHESSEPGGEAPGFCSALNDHGSEECERAFIPQADGRLVRALTTTLVHVHLCTRICARASVHVLSRTPATYASLAHPHVLLSQLSGSHKLTLGCMHASLSRALSFERSLSPSLSSALSLSLVLSLFLAVSHSLSITLALSFARVRVVALLSPRALAAAMRVRFLLQQVHKQGGARHVPLPSSASP